VALLPALLRDEAEVHLPRLTMPADSKSRPRLIARIQQQLFDELGGVCAEADECCSGPLQIDHPHGRDWQPRKVASYNRWLRYRREHQAGLIRLLCTYHNETIRPRPLQAAATLAPDPF
jgi:hypothetical protein